MRSGISIGLLFGLASVGTAQEPPVPAEPAPAAESLADSPIDFAVGNEVVTRAKVRKHMGPSGAVRVENREEHYRTVRLRLAKESVLYQHARHLGINVSAEAIREQLRDQIRKSTDPAAWYRAMKQVFADDLAEYVEALRRQRTIQELQRQVFLGPETGRAQPLQIIFSELRPTDVLRRADRLRAERIGDQPGVLWEAQVRGTDDDARQAALSVAAAWRDGPAIATLSASASRTAIEQALIGAGVSADATVDIVSLTQAAWADGIYREKTAGPLYHALRALRPGQVSVPVKHGSRYYIFRLVRDFRRVSPTTSEVEPDSRGELTVEMRQERLRATLAEALETMHVWPPELAEALRKESRDRRLEPSSDTSR